MPHQADLREVQEFIVRWKESGAAERANCQSFLSELCDVLEVARPQPAQAKDEQNAYVFERAVTFHNGDGSTSTGRIDLYKRGCDVPEAKQGSHGSQPGTSSHGNIAESTKSSRTRRGTAVRGTLGWDVAMRSARGQAETICACAAKMLIPKLLLFIARRDAISTLCLLRSQETNNSAVYSASQCKVR